MPWNGVTVSGRGTVRTKTDALRAKRSRVPGQKSLTSRPVRGKREETGSAGRARLRWQARELHASLPQRKPEGTFCGLQTAIAREGEESERIGIAPRLPAHFSGLKLGLHNDPLPVFVRVSFYQKGKVERFRYDHVRNDLPTGSFFCEQKFVKIVTIDPSSSHPLSNQRGPWLSSAP